MQDQFNYQQRTTTKKLIKCITVTEPRDKNEVYNVHKTILRESEKKRFVLFMLRKEGKCAVVWWLKDKG